MNPLQSIRTALSRRNTERRETATELYAALVVDLADEKTRDDHEQIETILDGSGRTVDELAADVDGLVERRKFAVQLKPFPTFKHDRAEMQARLDESKVQAEQAQTAYEDLLTELYQPLQTLDATIAQLNSITGKLSSANMAASSRGLAAVEPK